MAHDLKGLITFQRRIDNDTTKDIAAIVFDREGKAYIKNKDEDKTFYIDSDTDCILSVFNILFIDINELA